MCQNVHSYINYAVFLFGFFFVFFVLFGQPGLCLWSRTMRGSDAAQSDFLTFFLKCANC